MTAPDATPARGDVPDYTREKWRQRHKALTELCLENAERATAYARSLVALGECPTTLSTSNLDALAFRDTIDVLTAERDALAQRVRELEADRELLDYMEQQGSAWSRAPMRAVRGTEWCVRAEHDVGDTPTLREVLRISRSRDALRATPTPEAE